MEKAKNYRLKFIKYLIKDHVDYQIKLICMEDGFLNVEFMDRYSSLKELHETFKKEANSINYPKFPGKKYFGNTDEKFLNQRQTALEHYFNTILGSREFSSLPSLKKWIDGLIRKYDQRINQEKTGGGNKSSAIAREADPKRARTSSNQGIPDFLQNSQKDNIQRYKEVVDVYSKNFIDLGNDNNPHFEIEDGLNKEKNYKFLLKNTNALEKGNSKFFNLPVGDNGLFECLGLEEPKIAQYESQMLSKLNAVSKHIGSDISEEYNVEELIKRIDVVSRR